MDFNQTIYGQDMLAMNPLHRPSSTGNTELYV
jgi:hypothetical protein